jgi:hypothetical protein
VALAVRFFVADQAGFIAGLVLYVCCGASAGSLTPQPALGFSPAPGLLGEFHTKAVDLEVVEVVRRDAFARGDDDARVSAVGPDGAHREFI